MFYEPEKSLVQVIGGAKSCQCVGHAENVSGLVGRLFRCWNGAGPSSTQSGQYGLFHWLQRRSSTYSLPTAELKKSEDKTLRAMIL